MSDDNVENNLHDAEKSEVKGEQEDDFAAMLDKFSVGERLYPGQKVRAKVVSISGDLIYIDLGGKVRGP